VLKHVTPEMVAWWFGNIGGDIEIESRRPSRYLVWHPRDHILWQLARPGPDGRASRGARFRVVETFGRNPAHYIDVTETVTRLDATGITLEGYLLGQQVTQLKHGFAAVDGGTLYLSSLTIGTAAAGLRWIVNPFIRRMVPEAMGRAWLKHNIEEVGVLEHSTSSRASTGTAVDVSSHVPRRGRMPYIHRGARRTERLLSIGRSATQRSPHWRPNAPGSDASIPTIRSGSSAGERPAPRGGDPQRRQGQGAA
jgi:hypothetical protein